MSAPRDWTGVLGFPVTPFRQDLTVDLDGLAHNVAEMSKYPFAALVAAGGLGELFSLAPVEVEQVVRVTVENANRVPVVSGTGFNTVIGADLARRAERAGAEALLVLPPYYVNSDEDGWIEYYRTLGASTPLPLIGYSRDWAVFTPQQIARLADRVPNLSAWKDGQGDTAKFQRIMNYNGDRLGWFGGAGDDCVPAYFAIGVQAFTSSISNIAPRLSTEIAAAGMARDFPALDQLMRRYVHPLYEIRNRRRGYEVSVIKAAMEILGMPAGPVRPPLANCHPKDVADVRALIEIYRERASLSVVKA